MNIIISKAKNGSTTCSADNIFIHSSYNPQREAQSFTASLAVDFSPACLLIIEPALSYCLPFLRDRFPQAELACIRLDSAFRSYDQGWDFVFYFSGDAKKDSEALYSHFGEEKLCAMFTAAWPASERIFSQQSQCAWQAVKQSILKSRDVLYTRSYFSKRWLKNSIRFAQSVRKAAAPSAGSQALVIAASGPSLETSLPLMKKYRERFFLIAVSSAYLPLTKAGIAPDLTITTDGGWWAKAHVAVPGEKAPNILAASTEAALPEELFHSSCIIPLMYSDSMAMPFFSSCGLPFLPALRNGTVSGTALSLALSLTSGPVFFCGLDLAPATGAQHIKPNALDIYAAKKDRRLRPAETRTAAAQYSSGGSLQLYRSWFQSHGDGLEDKVYRLSDKYSYSYPLAPIRDVDWAFFAEKTKEWGKKAPIQVSPYPLSDSLPERNKSIAETLRRLLSENSCDGELFPVESIMKKRCLEKEKAVCHEKTIAEAKKALLEDILESFFGEKT